MFLFECGRKHTRCLRDKCLPPGNTRWRHGHSRGERKYTEILRARFNFWIVNDFVHCHLTHGCNLQMIYIDDGQVVYPVHEKREIKYKWWSNGRWPNKRTSSNKDVKLCHKFMFYFSSLLYSISLLPQSNIVSTQAHQVSKCTHPLILYACEPV